jgi:16S rRNA (guanine1207-N2)-methyltransferase
MNMSGNDTLTEQLILDALREESMRRMLPGVLLIGMQACSTVSVANQLVGGDRLTLLHLDRAAGAVGCGLGNREAFIGDAAGFGRLPDGDVPGDERNPRDGCNPGSRRDLERFAVVALNVEAAKSYRLLREVVRQTDCQVDDDGVVLVGGPRKGGAEVAARALREAFESVAPVTYRKGYRIYRAVGPRRPVIADGARCPGEQPPVTARNVVPLTAREVESVELRGRQIRLVADDRIFARGRLDPATRMLAEAFEIPPGAAVLDLGCGSGVLGILVALLEPSSHATLVDSDPLAVEASRRNAAVNGASAVSVYLSDVLRELPGQTFDVVLMNPPFHRGRARDTSTAERFIAEASQALRPNGAIYLVCNRFLRYEPILERLVGPVREVAGDRQYKVLLATIAWRLQSAGDGGRDDRAR